MSDPLLDGGARTLWRVSLPLMLSFLSMLGMMSVDRLFLAHLSPVALSAAVSAGTSAWALTFGCQTLTNISAVFVAQHNGAGRNERIAEPVWQMLWLSLAFTVLFVLAGIFVAPVIFHGSAIGAEQTHYFRWMMMLGPLLCAVGALNGFFIGRGRTRTITWLSLVGNLVNLVLDPLFIFGWGPVPSLGMAGACIATALGLLVQLVIMLRLFLSEESRAQYQSDRFQLAWPTMWSCIRVGSPEAIAVGLEIGAWGAFYLLLSEISASHILVASVGQSLIIVFFWFGLGMETGTSTIAGNLIGAGRKDQINRVFLSGCKINLIFAAGLASMLWLFGDFLVSAFLQNPENLEGAEHLGRISPEELALAKGHLRQSLAVIGLYVVLENLRMTAAGILRAAGDTFFLLILSVCSIWVFLLAPTYVLMTLWKSPISTCFAIWIGYAGSTALLVTLRFFAGSWRKKELIAAHA